MNRAYFLAFLVLSISFVYNQARTLTSEGIVGGELAPDNDFHYHVAIYVDENYACGGALLDDRHVLTAAQCVVNKEGKIRDETPIIVLAGVHDIRSSAGRVVTSVIEVYLPEGFNPVKNPKRLHHDIALLELERSIKRGPKISRVTLPERVFYNGVIANVSGFGVNYLPIIEADGKKLLGKPVAYGILRYLESEVITIEECKTLLPEIYAFNHICANVSGKFSIIPSGVCHGDSGGPLVIRDKNGNNVLIGILSSGPFDCSNKTPSVYTRVSSYLDFIERAKQGNKNMRRQSIKPSPISKLMDCLKNHNIIYNM